MLTGEDTPTIRFAIMRRLDKEPGVEICDLIVRTTEDIPGPMGLVYERPLGFIAVGILALLGQMLTTRSHFHLPDPFEIGHLHNEIDEIAEQYKAARKEFFGRGGNFMAHPEKQLAGTGLRGRWAKYG